MKKFLKNNTGVLAFSFAIIICLFFFVHIISLGAEYASNVNSQAASRAEFLSEKQTTDVESTFKELKNNAEFYAEKLSSSTSEDEYETNLNTIRYFLSVNNKLADIAIYSGGSITSVLSGDLSGNSELASFSSAEKSGFSKIFPFNGDDMCIASFSPVEGSYADGIALIYYLRVFALEKNQTASATKDYLTYAEFSVVGKQDGFFVDYRVNSETFDSDSFSIDRGERISGLFDKLLKDGKLLEQANEALNVVGISSVVFRFETEEYILSISSLGAERAYLTYVNVYKVSKIYGEGYKVTQNIWGSLLGLGIIMVIMITAIVVNKVAERRKIYKIEMIDSTLNCATPKKFKGAATEILKAHPRSKFAFVSMQINNFSYITGSFGEAVAYKLLEFSTEKIWRLMLLEETFAYAGDGEYIMLLNYRDRTSFTDRLSGLFLRLGAFDGFDNYSYKMSVSFAVYEINRDENLSMKEMFDRLKIVKENNTVKDGSVSIGFYDDILGENYLKKAEIEGLMESALANSEFHLFYQPKYNLKSKTLDGSEVLIRWYDNKIEKYRVPNEFLPVFEENGFIVKLDHFVFYKACENIAERIKNKKVCYPVSVNISRVTAIQPNFTDYYIKIKKKFNIKDNFLTLEFTESFAYENYDYLSDTVKILHDNGFLCSVDDFGTGYASYNILKTIPMDEIKLDKFFLQKGISTERDQTLLSSVIEMVKKLDMKVTQEGVETKGDLERLEALECDVIQGYLFAKPMKYVDYCEFIDVNFSK